MHFLNTLLKHTCAFLELNERNIFSRRSQAEKYFLANVRLMPLLDCCYTAMACLRLYNYISTMAHKKFSTSKYLLNDLRSHKQQSQFRAGHEAYSLLNSQLKLRTNLHSVYYGSLTCGSLFRCQFQRAWAQKTSPFRFPQHYI